MSSGKAIVILGMHRSGSSALASMLQTMNVNMGQRLYPPDKGNPLGHFEDLDFLEINEKILEAAGGAWHNPPSDFQIRVFGAKHNEDLKKLIELKQKNSLWGFKDPRTCLTLPLYMPLLTKAYFIVISRPCDEVADSLFRRDGDSFHFENDNQLLCNEYRQRTALILDEFSAPNVLRLSFHKLLSNPLRIARKINRFAGLRLPQATLKEAAQMIQNS